MIRRRLIVTSAISTLLFLPTAVFAQDPTNTAQRLRSVLEERFVTATAKREDVKNDIQNGAEELKEKWNSIENEEKRTVLAKIEELMHIININRTDHYTNVLARLGEILEKIQTRAERAKAEGKDVRTVLEAIETSTSSINIARNGVESQKSRTYTVNIEDEATAKNDAGELVKQLQTDLKATREMVVMARKAVFDAFLALKDSIGEDYN